MHRIREGACWGAVILSDLPRQTLALSTRLPHTGDSGWHCCSGVCSSAFSWILAVNFAEVVFRTWVQANRWLSSISSQHSGWLKGGFDRLWRVPFSCQQLESRWKQHRRYREKHFLEIGGGVEGNCWKEIEKLVLSWLFLGNYAKCISRPAAAGLSKDFWLQLLDSTWSCLKTCLDAVNF